VPTRTVVGNTAKDLSRSETGPGPMPAKRRRCAGSESLTSYRQPGAGSGLVQSSRPYGAAARYGLPPDTELLSSTICQSETALLTQGVPIHCPTPVPETLPSCGSRHLTAISSD